MGFGLKHMKFFEPLAPFGISYYLKGQLKKIRKQGRIDTYNTHVKRLGKWHYRIEITVDVTQSQIAEFLINLHDRIGVA